MKCHKCHQDTIYIEGDKEITYIKCEICGLTLTMVEDFYELLELFTYNFGLQNAYKEGLKSHSLGQNLNPYVKMDHSLTNKEMNFVQAWDKGWRDGEHEIETESLLFSCEKLKKEAIGLMKEKEQLLLEKEEISNKGSFLLDIVTTLEKRGYMAGFYCKHFLKTVSSKIKEIRESFESE